jgi:hypothetical protein
LGEDISHAAINVSFAADCARIGVEFDADDMFAFGETFVSHLYLSDTVFAEYVGGGGLTTYPQFAGLWLELAPWRPTVWTASADLYRQLAPAETLTSAWMLYSQAMLAKHAPPHCAHFFYDWDWEDQGEWRSATAYGANILTTPPDWSAGCAIPVEVDLDQAVEAAQWDGSVMHDVARWSATDAPAERFVAYDPAWPLEYWQGGVLFEFQDPSYSGEGIYIREPVPLMAPVMTSIPDTGCTPGEVWSYAPEAFGDDPLWWSIVEGPIDVRTNAATGEISWIPEDCTASFTLRVENDVGSDSQTWQLEDSTPVDTGDTGDTSDTGSIHDSGTSDSGLSDRDDETDDISPDAESESCGCGSSPLSSSMSMLLSLLAIVGWRRRSIATGADGVG